MPYADVVIGDEKSTQNVDPLSQPPIFYALIGKSQRKYASIRSRQYAMRQVWKTK